jgi:site-specific DNA-cytosine methylase
MDLFSGAGAFSLGLESTRGIETLWAVEIDPSSVLTFRFVDEPDLCLL